MTGDALANASLAAVDLAQNTGQSIESAAKEMEAVAKAPSKGLLDLDEKYNFLTASVYEHVEALEEQGRETDAVGAATAAAEAEFQKRAEAMKEQTRQLTSLVGELRAEWQSFANDLKNISAPTIEIDIAETQRSWRPFSRAVSEASSRTAVPISPRWKSDSRCSRRRSKTRKTSPRARRMPPNCGSRG